MKTVFVLLMSVIGVAICRADPSDISVYVKHTLSRFYLGSVGADFSDAHHSLSNDITISKGNCYAGLWMATGPGPSKYKEDWDPYVGIVHSFGPIKCEVTATYLVLSNIYESRDDLWSFDQRISPAKEHLIQPYLKIRAFNKVGSKSFESGWFGWVGATHSHSFGKATLNNDLSVAYSDGPFGKDPGFVYCRLTTGLSYSLTKSLVITPSLIYQVPTQNQRNTHSAFVTKNELVWGFSVGYPINFKPAYK